MWYIDECFLIWIISLTYRPRESIIWAYTTSFIHTCIYLMFNVFITCLFVLKLSTQFYMHVLWFRIIDIYVFSSFWIYCRSLISFLLLVIACTCMPEPHHLIMHTCDCLSTPLGFTICTRGVHLTTLDSHVQIQKHGLCWPYCSWSECAADPSVVIGVQQKLGHRRSSYSQLFFWLASKAPLAARELLSAFVMYISL